MRVRACSDWTRRMAFFSPRRVPRYEYREGIRPRLKDRSASPICYQRAAAYAPAVPRAARPSLAPSVVSAETALAVHKSPAQLRLETLQHEHERLLKEITKKRASREVVEREARDAHSALAARFIPLREAFTATLRELKKIFDGLLGADSHLSKRDKARVRRLYAQLLPDLAKESDNDGPRESRTGSDSEPPPPWERDGEPEDDQSESGYSATKPDEKKAGVLRALFRKLAVALHPDKVQDPGERDALTGVMKEVTRAYESGDVARLVEIERTWLAQAPVPDRELDVARRISDLLAANKELRRQLRGLTAELKELKQSIPATAPARRGARKSSPRSEVDELIGQMERELGELRSVRDFAQSFANGEIGIAEFMLGPAVPGEEAEDPFEQMLAEVLEAMADAPRSRKAPPARRRQRR